MTNTFKRQPCVSKTKTVLAIYEHGEEGEFSEEHYMTHEDCLAYLAQLPKTWHHFTTDEED